MAVQHAVFLWNHVPNPGTGLSPNDIFTKTRWNYSKFHHLHVWGCPVYVLDKRIADGNKIPRWKPRSTCCMYLALPHLMPPRFHSSLILQLVPLRHSCKLEVANVTKHSDEFLLMAKSDSKLAFKPTMDLLKDLNMFIYYTGATCDSTFSDIGMINLAESDSGTTITYGNGTSVKAAKRGDITGIICNKYGEEIKTATL